ETRGGKPGREIGFDLVAIRPGVSFVTHRKQIGTSLRHTSKPNGALVPPYEEVAVHGAAVHGVRPAQARAALVVLLVSILMCTWRGGRAGAAGRGECVPDSSTACIQGRIRAAAGDPATGVLITVEGQGQTCEATADDTGRW